ncbi:hypothetical protein EUX98_g7077 [Antrodiella citrinella]|uniref:Uncharacterized protein n=1 Tax=Antrodiella citrinella TaxID=2447956 RepID=A0A4S4MMM2_9APHY|nr:hypothetical protein EUX98_g7077 [Antrodiella citrinella]
MLPAAVIVLALSLSVTAFAAPAHGHGAHHSIHRPGHHVSAHHGSHHAHGFHHPARDVDALLARSVLDQHAARDIQLATRALGDLFVRELIARADDDESGASIWGKLISFIPKAVKTVSGLIDGGSSSPSTPTSEPSPTASSAPTPSASGTPASKRDFEYLVTRELINHVARSLNELE